MIHRVGHRSAWCFMVCLFSLIQLKPYLLLVKILPLIYWAVSWTQPLFELTLLFDFSSVLSADVHLTFALPSFILPSLFFLSCCNTENDPNVGQMKNHLFLHIFFSPPQYQNHHMSFLKVSKTPTMEQHIYMCGFHCSKLTVKLQKNVRNHSLFCW